MTNEAHDGLTETSRTYRAKEVTPFVLVFPGRCGSTYLMEALGRHHQINAELEYLATMRNRRKSADEQLEWARAFLTPPAYGPHAAVGFKTKLRDVLDRDGLAAVLRNVGAHLIHLQRRNLIKITVSSFNSERLAAATGDWNLYSHHDRLAPAVIDPEAFDVRLHQHELIYEQELAFIEAVAAPTLTLYYEDLLCDEAGTFERVYDFLGVPPMTLRGDAMKATSDDLREALGNFDALRARYAGTPYGPMFDEILVRDA